MESVYAKDDLDGKICPWCVADGSAAETLGAGFVQDIEAQVSADDASELSDRTPGYSSWQGELWLVHCETPMVFHGDLSTAELRALDAESVERFKSEHSYLFTDLDWTTFTQDYEPGGQPALYKFTCLHCGTLRLGCDFT